MIKKQQLVFILAAVPCVDDRPVPWTSNRNGTPVPFVARCWIALASDPWSRTIPRKLDGALLKKHMHLMRSSDVSTC
jgi:hypothetical protein